MQSVPGFPSELTVASPAARVLVDGEPVEFESVSIQSELESAMPAQVAVAGGAVVASMGSVVLMPGKDVVASPSSPWGSGVPPNNTEVVVEAGYGEALAKQFTGVTDGASGAPSDPAIPVSLIDGVDQLDRPITMEPLLNVWPSLTEGSWAHRRAGLSPIFITDKILRHCGFYATPQASGAVVFSATLMGSAWPEKGSLRSGTAQTDTMASAAWRRTPWGVGLGNGDLIYDVDLGGRSGMLDAPFQMVFNLDLRAESSSSPYWGVYWGNSALRIAITSAGTISMQVIDGGTTTVLTMPASMYADSNTFNVRWLSSGNVTIYAENGTNVSTTVTLPPVFLTTPMTHVRAFVPQTGHNLGGMWAGYSEYPSHSIPRNAHLTAPAFIYSLRAFPAAIDRNCADLLKEQAEAELAAMWLDENGHFRWVNRNLLAGASPVGTLTSEANLLDLPWETPAKSVYSKVEVASREAITSIRARTSITVDQGSASSMGTGDTDLEIIEPGADEDWMMVATPTRVSATPVNEVKYGRGSQMGGVLVRDAVESRWATATEFQQEFTRLPGGRYQIQTSVNLPESGDLVEQQIFGVEYGSYHGQNLPIIRAKAKAMWKDRTHFGVSTGPSRAPVLRHVVGAWIQDEAEIQALADWLADHVTMSAPIIRNVPIVPDPRIQKGDVFWLEDTHAYGVRLKVLVMGISLTISAGPPLVMEQSITCRIIEAQRPWVTLDEHDEVWAGKTLNQHDTFWSGSTLNQHDANPLAH